jgi:dihydrofolate synthase/folylpolyglutamate synthase
MNYPETLAYLDAVQARGIKLGLEGMSRLLTGMDDPQLGFPAIVVGGTNGKGSVCAMLASILRAAGCRAGLYTSPHLLRYEERIRVDGAMITPDEFARAIGAVRDRIDALLRRGDLESHPTHFEILTAAAFHQFRMSGVQAAVLEVGMGGRLDAVAVGRTVVAVITNVDLEHTEYLGATLEAIAFEKAGIIKEGCLVVTGESRPKPLAVIRNEARARGARLIERHRSAQVTPASSAASGRFGLTTRAARYPDLAVTLIGRHQVENATLAVLAAEAFREALHQEAGPPDQAGFEISLEAIVEGLARTHWPGRLQIAGSRPLLLLDGAHNPAGCAALARALKDLGVSGGWKRLCVVFGALKDKDFGPMLDHLLPLAHSLVLTRGHSDRFRDPEELAAAARAAGGEPVVAQDLGAALDSARSWARPEDAICLCGSLYLVGDAMERLGLDPLTM